MTKLFRGTYTAVITPFTADNQIDWAAFQKIVDAQIAGGVEGIVFVGTTGESPTLSEDEHVEVLRKSISMVNGRCKVIHGTGSNDTQTCIFFAKIAKEAGADGQLVVNPYYNKPTQKGLFQHFSKIADATDVPIILYNILGRTGVNLETSTLLELVKHPNIRAMKEASGNLMQMMDVIRKTPDNFSVLVGDDGLTLPFMVCGGDGVISVVSNALPKSMSNYMRLCLKADWENARKEFYKMLDIMKIAFIETNPIPIKEMMSMLGYCLPEIRLPMCRPEDKSMSQITEAVKMIQQLEK